MTKTKKDKVYKSYNKMYNCFDNARSHKLFEKSYLDLAISYLKPNAKILDVGCGIREPIGKYFIDQGFDLTGIDGSHELIKLARIRFPDTRFIVQDMREISLNEKFDLVIAWHSLFHLSRKEQKAMFKTFESLINKQGILLFTTGHENGEVWSDNGGELLYHASLNLLLKHNFEIIKYIEEYKPCGDATIWVAIYK